MSQQGAVGSPTRADDPSSGAIGAPGSTGSRCGKLSRVVGQDKQDLPPSLAVEAVAGASAAVAAALIARKAQAMRRRRGDPEERRADGSSKGAIIKLAEFAVLRLVFRSILHGVRFAGRRLLA